MKRKIIAAGGVVKNEKGELLMIFRRGKWDLPKGKLDDEESIEDCALREVKEETGLKNIDKGDLIDVTFHDYFDNWIKKYVVKETHWYAMKALSNQQFVPQTEEDIVEIKWVNQNELGNCLQNTYDNIAEIIHKAGY